MILTSLRLYQESAVSRAILHDGFGLFGEQRTGKTLTSLAVVDHRKPDILLVVCPLKAVLEWQQQIERHLKFDWECQVEVIHYEACCSEKTKRAKFRRRVRNWVQKEKKTVFCICDEAHRIKKRGSFQSRVMRGLGRLVTWRLALTGTPIAQSIKDAWAIFDYMMPGVFGELDDFEDRYIKYGGYKNKKIKEYKNQKHFNKIFHRYSDRKTLDEARRAEGKLPVKVKRRKIFVELTRTSRRAYEELEQELETVVNQKKISTPLVLTLTGKLQQLAGGYLIHDTRTPGCRTRHREIVPVGEEKTKALAELLFKFCPEDSKLVICARYRHELEVIGLILESQNFTYKFIAGGEKYDNKFDTDAIVLQIQSGIAIDLSLSNTYIFYSWDFSYINHEQSKFRVRSFDTDQVNYYYLIAEDTVDEDIYESLRRKKDLAQMICDKYRRKHRAKYQESN